jgi:hypothetical protein
MLNEETYNSIFDIGGKEVLTYKEMLLQYAKVRGLKRKIFTLPVFSPRLSSYWLYFVTAISYKLAVNLVNSMKVEIVCKDDRLEKILSIQPISYTEALKLAEEKINLDAVISSWKDALLFDPMHQNIFSQIEVPSYGCYVDKRQFEFYRNPDEVLENIWAIGGVRGWYYGDWLWSLRGFIDKIFGGVGLRRGRRSSTELYPGDALDFWRVLVADKHKRRLLLYAEMKLPGEAWLGFNIVSEDKKSILVQTATFKPKGLLGRLYWYSAWPFHAFIFDGMLRGIVNHI